MHSKWSQFQNQIFQNKKRKKKDLYKNQINIAN